MFQTSHFENKLLLTFFLILELLNILMLNSPSLHIKGIVIEGLQKNIFVFVFTLILLVYLIAGSHELLRTKSFEKSLYKKIMMRKWIPFVSVLLTSNVIIILISLLKGWNVWSFSVIACGAIACFVLCFRFFRSV